MIPQDKPKKKAALLVQTNITDASSNQFGTVDSAISITFPKNIIAGVAIPNNPQSINKVAASTDKSGIVLVQGMPFRSSNIMQMGEALTTARRAQRFPTTTPSYNFQAIIDDYVNSLAIDSDSNLVNAAATRVVNDIRATVKSQAAHGVEGVDMNSVMEEVFSVIENALNGQINNMSNITNAQNLQVNAIAGHVNAIDNHVQAMGNNVNAMGALLNSTNGNVTSLTANIAVLQTILTVIPQMVTNSVQDMLPDVIATAFEGAITNELLNRMQVFANTVQEGRAQEGADGRPPSYRSLNKRRNWFGRLNIFKKRGDRRDRRPDGSS